MDILEPNMTAEEMLEKIAELDHSKSQLKELNTEMRSWLDAADDDMATLRSENTLLKKQVKELEKMISDAQDVQSEPTKYQPDYPHLKISNEIKIQKMEKESAILKEENKKLNAEIRKLLHLQEQDDVSLNKLRASLQTLESEMEVAQIGLYQRDEVIQQKFQELKHAEEMVEEYSTIIKDLRLKNQKLKEELEAGQDEVAIAVDLLGAKERGSTPVLSFAEELSLLNSSLHVNSSMSDITPMSDEAKAEKLLKCNSESKDADNICTRSPVSCTEKPNMQAYLEVETKILPSSKPFKCVGILKAITQKVILFLGTLFFLLLLAFVTSGGFTGNSNLFSLSTLWSSAGFVWEPYCTLQYGGMPPI